MFAPTSSVVTIELESNLDGAGLYYSVGDLADKLYDGTFKVERSETLTIKASESYQGKVFLRWESQGSIVSVVPSMDVVFTTATSMLFKAIYAVPEDIITVTLNQTGGANAVLTYEVNGTAYTYTAPFTLLRGDDLDISATASGYTFLRWHDGSQIISTVSEKRAVMSSYGSTVTMTAAFALDAVTVDLGSIPAGATLYYTIGGLPETQYTDAFTVGRSETLNIRAEMTHSAEEGSFVRWESADTIMSLSPSMKVTFTSSASISFNAIFAKAQDIVTVTLQKAGAAGASLTYTLNGAEFDYAVTGPFTVLKDDTVVISAEASGYTFLRWHDGTNILSSAASGLTPDLSEYVQTVTFTAVFAETADVVEVTLTSDPDGAPLYYTIGGMQEASYNGMFRVERSEALTVRADTAMTSGESFKEWKDSSGTLITVSASMTPDLTGTVTSVSYEAAYAQSPSDNVAVYIDTTCQDEDVTYIVNGVSHTISDGEIYYVGAFPRDTPVIISIEVPDEHSFLRWYDGTNILSYDPDNLVLDLSVYGESVIITTMLSLLEDTVTVTLDSDPSGAKLYYTVRDLPETEYTVPFLVGNFETLKIRAETTHSESGETFLRWENAAGPVSISESMVVDLSTASSIEYTAVYVDIDDTVTIILTQTGDANASLTYTVNGTKFNYADTGPFTVMKDDNVVISAEATGYSFLRWHDGSNVISVTSTSDILDLSACGATVTFTAAFAKTADTVTVELESDPSGAVLHYTIGTLAEMEYTSQFRMERSEALGLRAASMSSGETFLRWESAGKTVGMIQSVSVSLPSTGTSATYTAVYAPLDDMITVTLEQTGSAGAELTYTVNGSPFDYTATGSFTVLRDDTVTLSASIPSSFSFLRWHDGTDILSLDAADMPLILDLYGTTVTVTAMFASVSETVAVDMSSDPSGAVLYYTIGDLSEMIYDGPFNVERSETLTIRADEDITGSDKAFLRWQSGGDIVSLAPSMEAKFTAASSMSFKAFYADEASVKTIEMDQIGGADADLTYTINGTPFDYEVTGPFSVLNTDTVIVSAEASGYTFLRWHDGKNILSFEPTAPALNMNMYELMITLIAVFALSTDTVTVDMDSYPTDAALYYTIGDLSEKKYDTEFNIDRSEKLVLRAETIHTGSGEAFLRWEHDSNILSNKVSMTVTFTTASSMSFMAVYAVPSEVTTVTLAQTGGADAGLTYTVNGTQYTYEGQFVIRRSDSLTISASVPSSYSFLRWHDSKDTVSLTPTASMTDMTSYGATATFTAALAPTENTVAVSLSSSPGDAVLYYTIGTLSEKTYSGTFNVARSETLTIRAETVHSGTEDAFMRWESAGAIIDTSKSVDIEFDSSSSMAFTAIYAVPSNILTVTLAQTGEADAAFTYTVNGKLFYYAVTGPFTIQKTDDIVITAGTSSGYSFLRWHDGTYIMSDLPDVTVDPFSYGSSVTLTAAYASSATTVDLDSDPSDAVLYYTVGDLHEAVYEGQFVVGLSEKLSIRAETTHSEHGETFLRWASEGTIYSFSPSETVTPSSSPMSFTALYAAASDIVTVTMAQTGEADATLTYTINNGNAYTYTAPFTISRDDQLSVSATVPSGFAFLRWHDGTYVLDTVPGTDIDISECGATVTLTAVFATVSGTVMVSLGSEPADADIYYKVKGLEEALYKSPFNTERDEKLALRAAQSIGDDGFVRWEGPEGVIGATTSLSVSLPATGTSVTYTAYYAHSDALATIVLEQTGGADASFSYTVNGEPYDYTETGPFTVIKSDRVIITAVASSAFTFLRWHDGAMILSLDPTVDSDNLDPSVYGTVVHLTAVFAPVADVVTVSLDSDPTGAELHYRIGSLEEALYTDPFNMERTEDLTVRALQLHGENGFLRWTGPDGIISSRRTTAVSLPETGSEATFIVQFVPPEELFTITLEQTGGADAKLTYTVNDNQFTYTGAFTVTKTDVITILAAVPDKFTFLRWHDGTNILSVDPSEDEIDLHSYGLTVVFTAMFERTTDVVYVTLSSSPSDSELRFTIGGLSETVYEDTFAVGRSEKLTIRAEEIHHVTEEMFVRWWSSGKIVSFSRAMEVVFTAADSISFEAEYAELSEFLTVMLVQTGRADSELTYTVNGTEFDYAVTGPFTVTKADDVIITASIPSLYSFLRWHDGTNVLSFDPEIGGDVLDLSKYGTTVTFTAMFASEDQTVEVTLASEPEGAELYYTIGDLRETGYTIPFSVEITETLSVRAAQTHPDTKGFIGWKDSSDQPITGQMSMTAPLYKDTPASFIAVYADAADTITITLDQTGEADATIIYTVNDTQLTYAATGPFTVLKSDEVTITASVPLSYSFLRWHDGTNVLSSDPMIGAGIIDLSLYGTTATFTAMFASEDDVVEITLISDPSGADMFYTIKGLREIQYDEPFYAERSETLTIRATTSMTYETESYSLIGWKESGAVVAKSASYAVEFTSDPEMEFEAAYIPTTGDLWITVEETGGSGVVFKYIKNDDPEVEITAGDTFQVSKNDVLIIYAEAAGYELLRWYDGTTVLSANDLDPLDLDAYGEEVTLTAMFAAETETVTIELFSSPYGAALYYTIGDLPEALYDDVPFTVGKLETLTIRAEATFSSTQTFLRWEAGGDPVSLSASMSVDLTAATVPTSYTALYAEPSDTTTIILAQTGEAGADLTYTVNGKEFDYAKTGTFSVLKDDDVTITASVSGTYTFLRWHDGSKVLSFDPTIDGDIFDLHKYGTTVTFTAVFASEDESVSVELISNLPDAVLYYKIGGLTEALYTVPFTVAASETLTIRAEATHSSGYTFLGWLVDGSPVSVNVLMSVDLMAGDDLLFEALYADTRDVVTVILAQTGGGEADLSYTINGTPFDYSVTGPFTVLKDDDVVLSALSSSHSFLRWHDGSNVLSIAETTDILNLSIYGATVMFTAVFVEEDLAVEITLASDPINAKLYYTIGDLKEQPYVGVFYVGSTEELKIRAETSHSETGDTFLRWDDNEGPAFEANSIPVDLSSSSVYYKAIYADPDEILAVIMAQTGGADAELYYIINGITFDYSETGPFIVKKSDDVALTAVVPDGFRFIRWYNGTEILSTDPTAMTLYPDTYGYKVTVTATFAPEDQVAEVTLTSDPSKAKLYYTIGDLQQTLYNGTFIVSKSEALNVRAENVQSGGETFIRWESEDAIVSFTPSMKIEFKEEDTSLSFQATYAEPSDILTVAMGQTGGADVALRYTVNGNQYDYSGPFHVRKGDILTISAEADGYTFLRWYDGKEIIFTEEPSDDPSELTPELYSYGATVTFIAMFAAEDRVAEVTLASEPEDAKLYYTIGNLPETDYNGAFLVGMSESLKIRAETAHTDNGYTFVRWEDASGMVSGSASTTVDLDSAKISLTAVYADTSDILTIIMAQTGGSGGADLRYAVNDAEFDYEATGPFTVLRSDKVILSTDVPDGDAFLRWHDGKDVLSLLTEMTLNTGKYGATVTVTAVFTDEDDMVEVTLTSFTDGALLYYTIGKLPEVEYTEPFLAERSETVKIRAEMMHTQTGDSFVRWESPAAILSASASMDITFTDEKSVSFEAVYAALADMVTVKMDQTGDADAVLTYTVNGTQYTYDTPFTVIRGDDLYI
jgi:hypothetical protein